ncbi:MAG: LysR family transcriptional regulator [Pseudomonadota bacterium]
MDRFSEIHAFVSVMEAGGFSAAARDAGRSRSSVNRLVIALEARLGAQLLNRTTRSVSPTSTGAALYEPAKRLLDDLDAIETAVASASTDPAGKLRISAPQSLGDLDFPKLIVGFMKAHPKVEIDVVFETRLVDPVAEGFDLALRIAEPDEETTLVDHRILELGYVLCAAPAYLDARGEPADPGDLSDHAVLHQGPSHGVKRWTLEGRDGNASVPVQARITSNTLDMLREAACQGLGIAMMPEFAVRSDLDSGRLKRVLSDYRLPSRMLQVIYPPTRHLSARVTAFVDFVAAWCLEGEGRAG